MRNEKAFKEENLLRRWCITDLDGEYILLGYVYNDKTGLYEDGSFIQTDAILSIDFVLGFAITKSGTYRLALGETYANCIEKAEEKNCDNKKSGLLKRAVDFFKGL